MLVHVTCMLHCRKKNYTDPRALMKTWSGGKAGVVLMGGGGGVRGSNPSTLPSATQWYDSDHAAGGGGGVGGVHHTPSAAADLGHENNGVGGALSASHNGDVSHVSLQVLSCQ